MPGAPVGLQARDVTIAQLLKPLGYATGQFGKNHLGDRNEYLPTVHGFDEFFGNLYHLNAEEDPEGRTYPQDPKFKAVFGPRGVLRCKATDRDDPTEQPRWGRVGTQTIEDSGPLTKKRMKSIDDETSDAAVDFIERQVKEGTPFYEEQRAPGTLAIWINPFTTLRTPKIFVLHADPYERADITSNTYYDWLIRNSAGPIFGGQALVAKFLDTFKEYLPSQSPASFSVDQIVAKMNQGA
jgi:arylsulfatase A-like enzyme